MKRLFPVPRAPLSLGCAALALALLTPLAVAAEERRVTLEDQTGIAVTIYNEDLALVRDRRTVPLGAGLNELAFIDVSAAMRPETALLRAAEGSLSILEQNFDFDLLTPQKLLEKSVGGPVRVVRTNPETGVDTVEEAVSSSPRCRPTCAPGPPSCCTCNPIPPGRAPWSSAISRGALAGAPITWRR